MTDDLASQGPDRLAAFSDGVFAIAITLLILPLADAEIDLRHVGESLYALAPRGFTFALSFAVIGNYWMVHHDNVRALTIIATSLTAATLRWYATFARKLVAPAVTSYTHARQAITGSLAAAVGFRPSIPLALPDASWAKHS